MALRQTNPFNASPSATGYLYQCRYALWQLLVRLRANPDAEVAIEKYDDVSFEQGGRPIELIQTKHKHNAAPDLSDKSPDLWKTLRVWAEGVGSGRIVVPRTTLTIATTATCAFGSAAALLRPEGGREPNKALQLLKKAAREMKGVTLQPARKAFQGLSRPQQEALVEAISVLDRSPDINDVADRIRVTLGFPVRGEHIPAYQERLEGWWFGQIILRLSGKATTPIRASDLLVRLDDLRESFRQDALPIDYGTGTPPNTGLPVDETTLFIRQLRLIGLLDKRVTAATTNYLRAYAQRSRWVKDNLLSQGHLDRYDERLIEEWDWAFQQMEQDTQGSGSKAVLELKGRELHDRVMENPRHIRTSCTEPFIGRGSYHLLANRLKVGWHRDYDKHLSNTTT